jgi:hypothetical protein
MPSYELALNGGTLVTPTGHLTASLGVVGGRIQTLSVEPLEASQTLDVTGKLARSPCGATAQQASKAVLLGLVVPNWVGRQARRQPREPRRGRVRHNGAGGFPTGGFRRNDA